METAPLVIPRPVPQQKIRPPKKNIPQTGIERNHILQMVRNYVAEHNPVPPQPSDELKVHADRLVAMLKCDPIYRDYIGVLISNEMWREHLSQVPFERRLLLLPKCLRVESKCPAPFDEFGLLCKQCGLCSIQDLQAEAERLGYAVLVAEGSAIVMSLIQTGKIEAIVGVSCLSVLERAFPYMEAAAIPGVAIPLLQDDCIDTNVDLDWVWDYIHLTSDDKTRRLDLGALRDEVDFWFTPASLDLVMGTAEGETERIGREWLGRAGKRWRPFLTVSAYQALRDDPTAKLPDDIRKIAVAVECFHKASLIHDDIEDNDATRYGEKTLHEEYGMAVALNVGDLLIGEGYRLIGACRLSAEQKAQMLLAASQGQRQLCRGQGAELCWARKPEPLTSLQVLDIFRQKTAPAFEVALRLGALYAGVDQHEEVEDVLQAYSEALGIAYQIRDDLSDLGAQGETNDILGLRPSLLLAVAYERAQAEKKAILDTLWRRQMSPNASVAQIENLYTELKADERARTLLETYKEEAIRSLRDLENPNLKGLLRRVIGKIFNDTEIKGWCKEFEQKNIAKRLEQIPVSA
ncbi:MAG TPA: polyprenyl synthetase family protein [Candidatus Saccharimonadales bacterium]|nr:polyprenyl synthetase family protein [Candidatus Saccharimonadales bacterium]